MKQLLFSFLFTAALISKIIAQPANESGPAKDSIADNKIFYFPVALYKDSLALAKAVPALAEQVLSSYSEPNKETYFYTTSIYYLLAGKYEKAMEMIDSIQKITDDKSNGIETRSYAMASMKEKAKLNSFDNAFSKDFGEAFNHLRFKQKVWLGFIDSNVVKGYYTEFVELREKSIKNITDSLDIKDARALLDKYASYKIYSKVFPLMFPFTNAPQYRMMHPAIKDEKFGGVAPVQDVDEFADPKMPYKLLMELSGFAFKGQDSTAKKEVNAGLAEVARQINLHVAAGVPKKNIDLVIVAHGAALYAFLNNEKYKKKYEIDNPNSSLIKELQDFGVKFIVCGQAMTFTRLEKTDLLPGIKQALTAQTVLSTYQLKGYVHYDLRLE